MKLYLVELSGRFEKIPDAYVVANDPTEAENIVTGALDKADYGFSDNRKIVSIKLLAEDYLYGAAGVLFQKDSVVKGLEPRKNK